MSAYQNPDSQLHDTGGTPVKVLHPGDVALAFEGDRLETLLGSCVSVILTDPRRTVAAMCHIVHAGTPQGANKGDTAFAVCAMQEMLTLLRAVGIAPLLCHAFVFGGGNMFPQLFGHRHVGASNLAWVEEFLRAQGIEVVGMSAGGDFYRKVRWTVGRNAIQVECSGVVAGQEKHEEF